MSYRTSDDFSQELSPSYRLMKGMLRRMQVVLSKGTLWRVLGQRGGPGGDETYDAESFPGIGLYATPPSSGNPQVILGAVGGAKSAVILATRDNTTRKAVCESALGVAQGETVLYNDKAVVYVKASGTVEIRQPTGVAESMVKGQTYRAAEDTMLTALQTALTALAAMMTAFQTSGPVLGTSAQQLASTATCGAIPAAAVASAATAITTFRSGAAAYLATTGKVQ